MGQTGENVLMNGAFTIATGPRSRGFAQRDNAPAHFLKNRGKVGAGGSAMSISRRLNPRAAYWRALKVSKAEKIASTRALETDLRAGTGVPRLACKRRTAARAFWQRAHPWVSREI